MKTAFLQAEAWRNLYKSYYYHGILMQCKTPPNPYPFIEIPITPPPPPTLFDYTADVLPQNFVPPYTIEMISNCIPTVAGSILTLTPINPIAINLQYHVAELSTAYFINHMRLNLYGLVMSMPTLIPPLGFAAVQLALIHIGYIGAGYIWFRQDYQFWPASWDNYDNWYRIYTIGTHLTFDYHIPFQGLYLDFDYDPITDETTVDYSGLYSNVVTGKININPSFWIETQPYMPPVKIDGQKISIE